MLDNLITFFKKEYVYIIIAIFVLYLINLRRENYTQLGGCVPYRLLGRTVGYRECIDFGYCQENHKPNSPEYKLELCKIGIPANAMRYKIIIDDYERFSEIKIFQPMGHVVGATLRFDNGKEYIITKVKPDAYL